MKIPVASFLFSLLSLCGFSETLILVDTETNSNAVEVVLREGAVIELEGKSYRIAFSNSAPEATARQLESIILPSIQFQRAPLGAVLEFLRSQSAMRDPKARGINIITDVQDLKNVPPVTLELRRVTLKQAFEYVTKITGTSMKIDEAGTIEIKKIKQGDG